MKLYELNVEEVLNRFEKEMFSITRKEEESSGVEFELFNKDDNHVYALYFDREEKIYAISMFIFEENGGDFIEQEILEPLYPFELYNREFIKYKIMQLMDETIQEIVSSKK